MSAQRSALVAVLVLAALAPGATAHAARTQQRPHSRVATYDHGDVLVRALQLNVRRVDHSLRARVRLTVLSTSQRTVRRTLRIATCTRANLGLAAPICPAGASIAVRLRPGRRRSYRRTVTLRQPPARTDSIQAALIERGTRQPFGYPSRTDAVLLVRGGAWRGAGAGHTYGVSFVGDTVARRLSFDIPATSRHRAYADVRWEGSGAPSGLSTTLSRCVSGTCTPQPLAADPRRSRAGVFGNRFDLVQGGAQAMLLQSFDAGSQRVLWAQLPWPG